MLGFQTPIFNILEKFSSQEEVLGWLMCPAIEAMNSRKTFVPPGNSLMKHGKTSIHNLLLYGSVRCFCPDPLAHDHNAVNSSFTLTVTFVHFFNYLLPVWRSVETETPDKSVLPHVKPWHVKLCRGSKVHVSLQFACGITPLWDNAWWSLRSICQERLWKEMVQVWWPVCYRDVSKWCCGKTVSTPLHGACLCVENTYLIFFIFSYPPHFTL